MARQEPVSLLRSIAYFLPDDLMFEGLVVPKGKETVRIRFSRGRGTTLDIPLSAESLALLIQTLGSLHGSTPRDLPAELGRLQDAHGFLSD
jgi:hypothetical protein